MSAAQPVCCGATCLWKRPIPESDVSSRDAPWESSSLRNDVAETCDIWLPGQAAEHLSVASSRRAPTSLLARCRSDSASAN
eukprot:scaffold211115_cov27-Tisochrysis_lutea.AAC.2